MFFFFFFFQAEDGIRDWSVTGVQTCALPIFNSRTTSMLVTSSPERGSSKMRRSGFASRAAEMRIFCRMPFERSEERRVGKECRSRWWLDGLRRKDEWRGGSEQRNASERISTM